MAALAAGSAGTVAVSRHRGWLSALSTTRIGTSRAGLRPIRPPPRGGNCANSGRVRNPGGAGACVNASIGAARAPVARDHPPSSVAFIPSRWPRANWPPRHRGDPLHRLPDLATSRTTASASSIRQRHRNSGHYYIDRDGGVLEFVPPERVLPHTRAGTRKASASNWSNRPLAALAGLPPPGDGRVLHRGQMRIVGGAVAGPAGPHPSLAQIAGTTTCLDEVGPRCSDREVRRQREPWPLFPWAVVRPT